MTQPDKNDSPEPSISELEWRATFRVVDAIDGKTVQAHARCWCGGEVFGYGHTVNEALWDLAASLSRHRPK